MSYALPVTDLELLREFEPVLRFNDAELFLPADVGAYVQSCSLWEREPDGSDRELITRGDLTLDELARVGRARADRTMHLRYVHDPLTRREYRRWRKEGHLRRVPHSNRFARVGVGARLIDALFRVSLMFRGRVPRGAVAAGEVTYREEIADGTHPYYGRVHHEAGWTILTYWFFYCMNDWRSSFHGINDHEADWENVILYLSPGEDGVLAPRWVAFSSHDGEGDALRRRVDDPDLEWNGSHVVAYPGAGSHSHSPRRADDLVRVDPPFVGGFLKGFRTVWSKVFPWTTDSTLESGFSVPFVDYHRGDGVSIGPDADRSWQPVVIDDTTPWVRDFRGRWGLDTRDRFGGESAPTGPKYERNGIDRVRWEDPLTWAGMQKVDPDPAAAARAVHARRTEVVARVAEIDTDVARERSEARSETVAARAMTGDSATSALADRRRAVVADHEARISELRAERRELEAELDALDMAEAAGLPLEGPRAHLGEHELPEHEVAESHVRQRVLRIWAAVSTPVLLAVIIWLLVGHATEYYWTGVLGGLALIIGFEALARGRLMSAVFTTLTFFIGIGIIIGLLQEWRITLAILLLIGAVVLLWQNIHELRTS